VRAICLLWAFLARTKARNHLVVLGWHWRAHKAELGSLAEEVLFSLRLAWSSSGPDRPRASPASHRPRLAWREPKESYLRGLTLRGRWTKYEKFTPEV